MKQNQKIAIPTNEGMLWSHFGKAPQVTIVTVEDGQVKESVLKQSPEHEHGAMPRFLAAEGCTDVVCGGLGQGAVQMLAQLGIEVHAGAPALPVEQVLAMYLDDTIGYGDGSPYGVPLSLARKDEKTFYFHGALEGDKMDCIANNPKVALSAVSRCTPTVGPKDGSFTLQYKSAMEVGVAEVVTDRTEKVEALRLICQRFLPHHMDAFDTAIERSLERTAVVKITLTEPPTGKRKQYDKQGEEMKWQRME